MPLPGNLSTVTVTGTYVQYDGSVGVGTVSFTTPGVDVLVDPAADRIILAKPLTASLDGAGHFTIAIPVSDDPDVIPTGFTWHIEENVSGHNRSYDIVIPASTPGGTLDLADVTTAVPYPGNTAYVLVPSFNDLVARVTVLEAGSGGGGIPGGAHRYDVTDPQYWPVGVTPIANCPLPTEIIPNPTTAGATTGINGAPVFDWQPVIDLVTAKIVADNLTGAVMWFPAAAGAYAKSGKIRCPDFCTLDGDGATIVQMNNSLISGSFFPFTVDVSAVSTVGVGSGATGRFTLVGHGLTDGVQVIITGLNTTTGLTNGNTYFVRDSADGDHFRLTPTLGGAAPTLGGSTDTVTITRTKTNFARSGAGMVEPYDDHCQQLRITNGIRLCGNRTHQLGHNLGTAMTLATTIANDTTTGTFQVTGLPTLLAAPFRLTIGVEVIQVVAKSGITCTPQAPTSEANGSGWSDRPTGRGWDDSIAASHAIGELVELTYDAVFVTNEGSDWPNDYLTTDTTHIVSGVTMIAIPGNGVTFNGFSPAGAGSFPDQTLHRAQCHNCEMHGIDGIGLISHAADSDYDGNVASSVGRHGFWANGGNNVWGIRNKAYFTGQRDARRGEGIKVTAGRQTIYGMFQDAWRNGVYVDAPQIKLDVECDANGHGKFLRTMSVTNPGGANAILTAAASTFKQSDIGLQVWDHPDIPADTTIIDVATDGSTATLDTNITVAHTPAAVTVSLGVDGYGIEFDGATEFLATVMALDRHPGNNSLGGDEASQQAAVHLMNSSRGKLRLTAWNSALATVKGDTSGVSIECGQVDGIRTWGTGNGSSSTGTTAEWNTGTGGGPVVVGGVAGAIILDPNKAGTHDVILTSGVPLTVANPRNFNLYQNKIANVPGPCFKGQTLRAIFTQPAAGTPVAVTFGSEFVLNGASVKVALGAITTMNFTFNGTKWICMSSSGTTMVGGNNLSEITDRTVARTNLRVPRLWRPSDHSLLACSIVDPAAASATFTPTAGVPTYCRMWMPAGGTLANLLIRINQGGTGATALANCYLAAFDLSGTRLGRTADKSAEWASVGQKTDALVQDAVGSLIVPPVDDGYIWVGILVGTQATTPVTISASGPNANMGLGAASPYRAGTVGAALTDLPTSFTPTALTAGTLIVVGAN